MGTRSKITVLLGCVYMYNSTAGMCQKGKRVEEADDGYVLTIEEEQEEKKRWCR